MTKNRFRAVGFDYGGVIEGLPASLFVERLCALVGITKAQYREVYFAINYKINKGVVAWPDLWGEFLESFNKKQLLPQVLALSEAHYRTGVHTDVLDLVDALRQAEYKTGVLSNNTVDMRDRMQTNGVMSHFDVVHVSAVTGRMKPEPEAFRAFADDLGVSLSELIYIDDSKKSLSTSVELGYTPIFYQSLTQLQADLAALGIVA